jgi:hypothetical protein
MGDFEFGGRYTWANAGSPFTHAALAFDAGFPSGNPHTGTGEGAYGLSPSVLLSHEFMRGRYQAFSTTGFEFVLARRHIGPEDEIPHHQVFANSGVSFHAGRGWAVTELSANTNRWSGGNNTEVFFTPSYVWRLASRTELLAGVPIGLTSMTKRAGGIVKFTFELGGEPSR